MSAAGGGVAILRCVVAGERARDSCIRARGSRDVKELESRPSASGTSRAAVLPRAALSLTAVLQMLVVMMLVLAVVMPRRHGSQVLPGPAPPDSDARLSRLDLWIWIYAI